MSLDDQLFIVRTQGLEEKCQVLETLLVFSSTLRGRVLVALSLLLNRIDLIYRQYREGSYHWPRITARTSGSGIGLSPTNPSDFTRRPRYRFSEALVQRLETARRDTHDPSRFY